MPGRSSIIPDPPASRGTVLLVDPDHGTRAEMAGWLHGAGYATLEADAFDEGRHLLVSRAPDILVAGVRLGAFNGLHLVITARAARPDLRAVLTTSADDGALAGEARQAGAAYLVKPLGREAFLAAVVEGGEKT